MAERKYQKRNKTHCSNCGGLLEPGRAGKYRYCNVCHAKHMRETRPKLSEMTEDQRKRANARAYLHVYIKRGKVKKLPCQDCGSGKSEAHHSDYNKPLEVVWYCRDCHLKHHNEFDYSPSGRFIPV